MDVELHSRIPNVFRMTSKAELYERTITSKAGAGTRSTPDSAMILKIMLLGVLHCTQ